MNRLPGNDPTDNTMSRKKMISFDKSWNAFKTYLVTRCLTCLPKKSTVQSVCNTHVAVMGCRDFVSRPMQSNSPCNPTSKKKSSQRMVRFPAFSKNRPRTVPRLPHHHYNFASEYCSAGIPINTYHSLADCHRPHAWTHFLHSS